MLATNPKTGKPIKIMKSDTSIWKDSKTLVWMKDEYSPNKKTWKRWNIIVTSVKPKFLLWNPDIVLLTEETEESNIWLKSHSARNVRFILVSLSAIKTLNSEGYDVSNLGNVMCLEEFDSMYPFLGPAWDGSLEDAIMCTSIIFRYNRVIGLNPDHPRIKKVVFNDLKISVYETHKAPEPLVLIQQYYKPADKTRAKELYKCLAKNLECDYVDKIYLFVESFNLQIPADPEKKIIQMLLKSRLSYADCIYLIQEKIGAGHLVAFANADIYLDETWKSVWSINLKDIFIALLRWEEKDGAPEIFGPRNDSQDTWLIHSDSVLSRSWDFNAFNIPFGKSGCDNAILIEFLRNRFKIINPAMNLRTIHVHESEYRTYEKADIVDRPNYMFVEPTGIHELNPITSWTGWAGEPIVYEPLDRTLRSTTGKNINMFCSQMNRDPTFVWAADGLNTYLPPIGQDRPINMSGGAFVSPNGLVYRHTDICVGTTDIQKAAWSDNKLSHLMASYNVDVMMAFNLESEWLDQPALFVLYYLSKVVQQNKKTPEASFWCKKTNALLAAINLFKWERSSGRLLEYNDQTQVFAQQVWGRSCHGTKPVKIDIDELREAMDGRWCGAVDEGTILIVQDSFHLNGDLFERLVGLCSEYKVRTITSKADASSWYRALSGVSRVILSSSLKNIKDPSWAWMWLGPVGCKILELQEEREPSDSLVHLAAASGQEWTLLQYPRSTPEGFKKIVEKEVSKWLAIVEKAEEISLQVVHTPPRSMKFGFFGHKGDSFREMIDLWVEKGLVTRKEDPSLTQCWLGGVGDTLLYDRPTWAWFDKASEKEKSYRLCLVGNPSPSDKLKAYPWIFWPREPRLVEEMASKVRKTFSERSENMVFYGRIENEEQGSWRKDLEWEQGCSKFSMQKGKEPYLLKPREYLEALGNAKYGLCLRGYGPKCNREIELLAMGTVPVITSDVDISNYSEPLINGVHVIKVDNKEDAMDKLIYGMSEAKWTEMSEAGYQWWLRNCSVEGSWATTSALYTIQ
jgi:hypothetical protein